MLIKVQRFLKSAILVAEQFTGLKGVLVPIEDTIMALMPLWMESGLDIPKQHLTLVGTLEDAIEKGKKLMEAAKA
ncbi:MAG: hypothetical protein R2765_05355 [Ferruginibacter sp.]